MNKKSLWMWTAYTDNAAQQEKSFFSYLSSVFLQFNYIVFEYQSLKMLDFYRRLRGTIEHCRHTSCHELISTRMLPRDTKEDLRKSVKYWVNTLKIASFISSVVCNYVGNLRLTKDWQKPNRHHRLYSGFILSGCFGQVSKYLTLISCCSCYTVRPLTDSQDIPDSSLSTYHYWIEGLKIPHCQTRGGLTPEHS